MAIFTAIASLVSTAVLGLNAALAGLGISLTQLALGAALSIAGVLLTPRPKPFQSPVPQQQAVVNQSTAPRRRIYGRAKVGGVRAFFDSRGGKLYQVVMFAQGPVDGFDSAWIGDRVVAIDSEGRVTDPPFANPQGSYVTLRLFDGGPDQIADNAGIGNLRTDIGDVWTVDHRLRGVAYARAVFFSPPNDRYLEVFPEGYNTAIRGVIRGARVLDTRTGGTAWTQNPALILRDYLTHPDGYRRLTADDIDVASFNAFATLCDEAVPLAAGGAEPRYRCGGAYELTDAPTDVIARVAATCDAELYTTREGKVAIRGGQWTPPTVTIDPADILAYQIEEGADALDRFNQLKIVYTSPEHDFQPTESEPWEDLADQAVRGVVSQDFSVDMVPSPSQARRLAKIAMAKANPRWRGSVRTNLTGLSARGERTITLRIPELLIDAPFLVTSHNLILDEGMPIGCELGVSSLDAGAYAWNAAAEEGQNPPPAQDTRPDLTLETPADLRLRTDDRSARVILATVRVPERDGVQLESEIRLSTLDVWEPMGVAAGSFEALSGAVVAGQTYFVRARFRVAGVAGPWTEPVSIVAVFSTTAPAAPTGFSASQTGGVVTVAWTSSAYRVRVFRAAGASAVFADAVEFAEVGASPLADAPGAGTWRYWAAARNEGGFQGASAGPQTVTIT